MSALKVKTKKFHFLHMFNKSHKSLNRNDLSGKISPVCEFFVFRSFVLYVYLCVLPRFLSLFFLSRFHRSQLFFLSLFSFCKCEKEKLTLFNGPRLLCDYPMCYFDFCPNVNGEKKITRCNSIHHFYGIWQCVRAIVLAHSPITDQRHVLLCVNHK